MIDSGSTMRIITAIAAVVSTAQAPVHCSELFALPWEMLFDRSGRASPVEVPLWSGLTLQVLAQAPGAPPTTPVAAERSLPLKDLQTALIRKAVAEARGNVVQAARALGISRATVYRKLGKK